MVPSPIVKKVSLISFFISVGSFHNTCLCPYSVYTALSCTLCGCDGETKTQLAKTLHLPETGVCKESASVLKKMISCGSEVEISSANGLFIESSARIHNNFISETKELFHSEVKNVSILIRFFDV